MADDVQGWLAGERQAVNSAYESRGHVRKDLPQEIKPSIVGSLMNFYEQQQSYPSLSMSSYFDIFSFADFLEGKKIDRDQIFVETD